MSFELSIVCIDQKSASLRTANLSAAFYLDLLDQIDPNSQELLALVRQQVRLIELLRQGLLNDAPDDQHIERVQIAQNAERLLTIWPRLKTEQL